MVFVCANADQPPKYRCFRDFGFEWTPDIEKAVWYARRSDAEAVHGDDTDVWYILTHSPAEAVKPIKLPGVLAAPEGAGVAPQMASPELMEHLKALRSRQYLNDRADALRGMSVHEWIKFALRWGLAPPPRGFEDHQTLRAVMHKVRLCLTATTHEQALESAQFLIAHNIKLPGSLTLVDGVLAGDPNAQQTPH